jgi:hypothetical protein
MAALAKLVALYCGQGMAHLLEIYNDGKVKDAADHLVLVDFGGNKKPGANAVDYVVAKLGAQRAAMRPPTIDLMILSHQDGDHLNLLGPLGIGLKNQGIKFTLGTVYAGGHAWEESNIKTVNTFVHQAENWKDTTPRKLFNSIVKSFEPSRCDYDGASKIDDAQVLGEFGFDFEIKVRVAVAQLPPVSKVKSDICNGTSAVIVIENGKESIVLPGDATYQTLHFVNEKLYDSWTKANLKPLIPPVTALEVPHHGAICTSVQGYDPQGATAEFDFDIIKRFAGFLAAKEIFASAGLKTIYGHPVKEVLDKFKPYLIARESEFVAFVFSNKGVERKDRFAYFKKNYATRTTRVSVNPDVMPVWTNITVRLGNGVLQGEAVSNTLTLDEILAEQGLRPAAPPRRPPVYAPAPTPDERGEAAPPPASA